MKWEEVRFVRDDASTAVYVRLQDGTRNSGWRYRSFPGVNELEFILSYMQTKGGNPADWAAKVPES